MSNIRSSVAKIFSGGAIAQLLILLSMPIISRLYQPSDFGVYGVIISISVLIAIISSFQLHQAIIIPRHDKEAIGLFHISCAGVFAAGIVVFIVSFLYSVVATELDSAGALFIAILTGLAVIAFGFGQATQALVVRAKKFEALGWAALVRAVVIILIQIATGVFEGGVVGLLVGYVTGELMASLVQLVNLEYKIYSKFKMRRILFFALLRRYKDFATYGCAQEAMSSASQAIPQVLLAIFYGSSVAGYYAFAIRILYAPVNLFANSIRQVLGVHFAEMVGSKNSVKALFVKSTLSLMVPIMILTLLAVFIVEDAYVFAFGENWKISGTYSEWLLILCVFSIFNVPSTLLFRVLRKQKFGFVLNVFALITKVLFLFIGGYFLDPLVTVAIFCLVGVFWNVVTIYYGYLFSTERPSK